MSLGVGMSGIALVLHRRAAAALVVLLSQRQVLLGTEVFIASAIVVGRVIGRVIVGGCVAVVASGLF